MNQSHYIIEYMKRYGSITPLQALKELGCFRLASRINELRQEGHDIKTIMVGDGDKKYAKYTIENETTQKYT